MQSASRGLKTMLLRGPPETPLPSGSQGMGSPRAVPTAELGLWQHSLRHLALALASPQPFAGSGYLDQR